MAHLCPWSALYAAPSDYSPVLPRGWEGQAPLSISQASVGQVALYFLRIGWLLLRQAQL